MNTFTRGARLTSTSLTDGVVKRAPADLVAEASKVLGFEADANIYALARMGRSEGVDGMEYRMHVALNDLDDLQSRLGFVVYTNIESLMTHSKVERAKGYFSEQNLGKRYATSRDPYVGDYQLAEKVYVDHQNGIDPTGGARKFVDKNAFGAQAGTGSYAALVDKWAADGLQPANLPGASDNFVVFRG